MWELSTFSSLPLQDMYQDRIPTLDAWLLEFVRDPRLELIWLDVKVAQEKMLPLFVRQLKKLLLRHGISRSKSTVFYLGFFTSVGTTRGQGIIRVVVVVATFF